MGGGILPTNKNQSGKQVCVTCKKEKRFTEFYSSDSEIFSLTGKVPMCKDCMYTESLDANGELNLDKFKEVLRKVDKPFILKVWQVALNEADKYKLEGKNRSRRAYSYYFKNINSLKQYKHFTFKDSGEVNKRFKVDNNGDDAIINLQNKTISEEKVSVDVSDFEVTDEVIKLFGEGYSRSEYKKMIDKYEKLKVNYTLQTNLHQEALATYARFKVKEEDATARGDVDEAKKWYDIAQSAASNGKLTPKQLSAADLQQGMNSVSELIKAVEQATDVVKILPQFKYRPNDSVDFTIMCYVNYERKLNGQPEVTYEDVYKFYSDKKKEYIKQNGDPYGIFDDDPTEKNREIVKTFLKMPDDYDVLSGESDD